MTLKMKDAPKNRSRWGPPQWPRSAREGAAPGRAGDALAVDRSGAGVPWPRAALLGPEATRSGQLCPQFRNEGRGFPTAGSPRGQIPGV